jgi:hypothetical protein
MNYEQQLIDGITKVLVQLNYLSTEDARALHEAFDKSEVERFEEFLLDEDVVNKEDLLKCLQIYYQLPAIDVVGILFEHNLVIKFPTEVMLNAGFIPYQRDGDIVQIISARPQDADLQEIISNYVSYESVFMVGIYRDICDAVKEFHDEALTTIEEDEDEEEDDLRDAAEEIIEGED